MGAGGDLLHIFSLKQDVPPDSRQIWSGWERWGCRGWVPPHCPPGLPITTNVSLLSYCTLTISLQQSSQISYCFFALVHSCRADECQVSVASHLADVTPPTSITGFFLARTSESYVVRQHCGVDCFLNFFRWVFVCFYWNITQMSNKKQVSVIAILFKEGSVI